MRREDGEWVLARTVDGVRTDLARGSSKDMSKQLVTLRQEQEAANV
jgi:hypothetical protein